MKRQVRRKKQLISWKEQEKQDGTAKMKKDEKAQLPFQVVLLGTLEGYLRRRWYRCGHRYGRHGTERTDQAATLLPTALVVAFGTQFGWRYPDAVWVWCHVCFVCCCVLLATYSSASKRQCSYSYIEQWVVVGSQYTAAVVVVAAPDVGWSHLSAVYAVFCFLTLFSAQMTSKQILWSQTACEAEKTTTNRAINQQGNEASETLSYRVQQHDKKTSQTIKIRK